MGTPPPVDKQGRSRPHRREAGETSGMVRAWLPLPGSSQSKGSRREPPGISQTETRTKAGSPLPECLSPVSPAPVPGWSTRATSGQGTQTPQRSGMEQGECTGSESLAPQGLGSRVLLHCLASDSAPRSHLSHPVSNGATLSGLRGGRRSTVCREHSALCPASVTTAVVGLTAKCSPHRTAEACSTSTSHPAVPHRVQNRHPVQPGPSAPTDTFQTPVCPPETNPSQPPGLGHLWRGPDHSPPRRRGTGAQGDSPPSPPGELTTKQDSHSDLALDPQAPEKNPCQSPPGSRGPMRRGAQVGSEPCSHLQLRSEPLARGGLSMQPSREGEGGGGRWPGLPLHSEQLSSERRKEPSGAAGRAEEPPSSSGGPHRLGFA